MTQNVRKTSIGAAALAVCALVGATVAFGAGTSSAKTATTGTSTTGKAARTPETALTGDALAKVTAATIAKVGGTVDSATTENDGSSTAAVYEAHVTKADGTHVTVILDSAYAVLSVETGGPGGPGGHDGRGGGNGETALTGDVAAKAKAAAIAKAGGTADRATTETDSSNAAAAYEVHVTKADGSHVVVILDKAYAVLSVETQDGRAGAHGSRH
jgi:uncharacterized membrane protein YkoI